MEAHGIDEAVRRKGSQSALARALNTSPQVVQQWQSKRRIPAEWVLKVERETGVPRHELRPDLYPAPEAAG